MLLALHIMEGLWNLATESMLMQESNVESNTESTLLGLSLCSRLSTNYIDDLMKSFNSNGLIHDIIVVSMKKVCNVTN